MNDSFEPSPFNNAFLNENAQEGIKDNPSNKTESVVDIRILRVKDQFKTFGQSRSWVYSHKNGKGCQDHNSQGKEDIGIKRLTMWSTFAKDDCQNEVLKGWNAKNGSTLYGNSSNS